MKLIKIIIYGASLDASYYGYKMSNYNLIVFYYDNSSYRTSPKLILKTTLGRYVSVSNTEPEVDRGPQSNMTTEEGDLIPQMNENMAIPNNIVLYLVSAFFNGEITSQKMMTMLQRLKFIFWKHEEMEKIIRTIPEERASVFREIILEISHSRKNSECQGKENTLNEEDYDDEYDEDYDDDYDEDYEDFQGLGSLFG
tara:strand:- start:258 stop:848 length:591 start_codon:yes stop_codon:yes gene_type:complete